MKKDVTILDYGIGNLLSVSRAIHESGGIANITDDREKIATADYLILPGVGNFSLAIKELRDRGFEESILNHQSKERPLLGICLGMQLFFDSSEEEGLHKGLGIISGSVKSIPTKNQSGFSHKIPHIGWSPLELNLKEDNESKSILNDQHDGQFFYFIHSYQGHVDKAEECIAITKYNDLNITAVIQKNYAIGCQFHPEKSGENGIKFLKSFLSY
ncbi:MAG: imidazole glycerol phosphate synthase subunit HisH [Gammaproteobacteria bacterium]|nr:imidazole glycerol phosphate synthase subunit HisH [Gammaproteobacteria bacterium]|tara:strand:+ start:1145 stop:1789 length:645 start_codon:yes stop_codon:yes gene_type:complete